MKKHKIELKRNTIGSQRKPAEETESEKEALAEFAALHDVKFDEKVVSLPLEKFVRGVKSRVNRDKQPAEENHSCCRHK